ncbi:MAG: hypothetical protein A2082_00730 [Chloroflexi bacterium GWC2_70_10]|nr:MAG: hypothetical protein A2082_00730 [Chloroflexi bacterium GWC2_70_10]
MREHPRLAGAGPGQDQQGPFAMRYGRALLRIQGVEDRVLLPRVEGLGGGLFQRSDGMGRVLGG